MITREDICSLTDFKLLDVESFIPPEGLTPEELNAIPNLTWVDKNRVLIAYAQLPTVLKHGCNLIASKWHASEKSTPLLYDALNFLDLFLDGRSSTCNPLYQALSLADLAMVDQDDPETVKIGIATTAIAKAATLSLDELIQPFLGKGEAGKDIAQAYQRLLDVYLFHAFNALLHESENPSWEDSCLELAQWIKEEEEEEDDESEADRDVAWLMDHPGEELPAFECDRYDLSDYIEE